MRLLAFGPETCSTRRRLELYGSKVHTLSPAELACIHVIWDRDLMGANDGLIYDAEGLETNVTPAQFAADFRLTCASNSRCRGHKDAQARLDSMDGLLVTDGKSRIATSNTTTCAMQN